MRVHVLLLVLVMLAADAMAASVPVPLFAERAAAGDAPEGCTPTLAGGGGPARWVAVTEPEAPGGVALAETSRDKTDARFPLCIHEGLSARDLDVSARFRPIGGYLDQAGGIAVRLHNLRSYYLVRANALENNVRLYHVADDMRRQLGGRDVKVAVGEWHTLRLRVEGDRFQVFFDGAPIFEARDGRIAGAGRVALWSKADSVTHFAGLNVEVLP